MNHKEYISYEKRGKGIAFLLIAEFAGTVAGSFCSVFSGKSGFLFSVNRGGTVFEAFSDTVLMMALFLAAAFFCGLFAFGQPLGIALLMAVGAENGAYGAELYASSGISAAPLFLLRTAALSAIAVLAVSELLRASTAIFLNITGNSAEFPQLGLYCVKFIVLSGFALAASIADSLLKSVFIG